MDQSSPSMANSRSVFPWLAWALVVVLGAGTTAFWLNQKIDSVQAAAASHQVSEASEIKRDVTGLQQAIAEIQAGQQKLLEQVNQLQRAVATNQGERKLLSEQVGALSSRVDALASSNAEAASQQQPQSTGRRRR